MKITCNIDIDESKISKECPTKQGLYLVRCLDLDNPEWEPCAVIERMCEKGFFLFACTPYMSMGAQYPVDILCDQLDVEWILLDELIERLDFLKK